MKKQSKSTQQRLFVVPAAPARDVPRPRTYGGRGILTLPPAPYGGPQTFEVKGMGRTFVVTHLSRSPTGSTHGSFKVEEEEKGRLVVLGYTTSWPSYESCVRVANQKKASHVYSTEVHRRPRISHAV